MIASFFADQMVVQESPRCPQLNVTTLLHTEGAPELPFDRLENGAIINTSVLHREASILNRW